MAASTVATIFASYDGVTPSASLTVLVQPPPNTSPAITVTSASTTQGAAASTSSIAMVSDAEDARNNLAVTVNNAASATANGVTISSIRVDASGQVTAIIGADCNAPNASFTLRVTDSGGLFAEATLDVTVTPETIPPVIACPANDAESDAYTYVWKTEESWAGTCRQLIVRLNDGSERVAFFKFM